MYTKDIMKRIQETIQSLTTLYGELSEEIPPLYDANENPTLMFPTTLKKKKRRTKNLKSIRQKRHFWNSQKRSYQKCRNFLETFTN